MVRQLVYPSWGPRALPVSPRRGERQGKRNSDTRMDRIGMRSDVANEMTDIEIRYCARKIGITGRGQYQRLTCPSCPPVASFLSIASHSTQRTQPLWPDNTWDGVSVNRSHNLALQSPEPVARRLPVGENEAHRIGEV